MLLCTKTRCSNKSIHFLIGFFLGVFISLTYSFHYYLPGVGINYDCKGAGQLSPIAAATNLKGIPKQLKSYHVITKKSRLPTNINEVEKSPQDLPETDDSLNLLRFIDPPFSSNRKPAVHGSEYLQTKITFRDPLLVAVVTSSPRINQMEVIYDTWARSVSQVVFFIESSDESVPDGLPVVKLPGISDSSSEVLKTFAVFEYLNKHYFDKYNWFIKVTDTAYLRGERLLELVNQLDPTQLVYMGQPASHEQYCKGGPGMLFSRTTVQALSSHLDKCWEYVQLHKSNVKQSEDFELGRCLNMRVGIRCNSTQLSKYFMEDSNGDLKSLENLKRLPENADLLTLFPVESSEHMYTIHYYYTTLLHQKIFSEIDKLKRTIQQMCAQVPIDDCNLEKPQDAQTVPKQRIKSTRTVRKFVPQNRFQVLGWNYFDALALYEDDNLSPRRPLKAHKYNLVELQKALLEAVKAANRHHPVKIKFKQLINGYVRHNALVGSEYIIDAEFVEVRNPKKHVKKRVSLIRHLSSSYTVQHIKSDASETVHIVVPLYSVNGRFSDFMQMYEQSCLSNEENTHLVLAVFGQTDFHSVNSIVSSYKDRYPTAQIDVLQGYAKFSRARALHLGLSSLKDNDLVFLCDVDIHVNVGFFTRCRQNTIQGKRVYYPEVFKLYNMYYVYRNQPTPKQYSIARENGHWGHYAFGMACMYKSDYLSTGGFDVNMMGWGGEDVELYEKVIKTGLEVFRTPDVGLVHQWHSKTCSGGHTSKQYEQCMMSKAEVLADRRELAQYIYELEEQKP